jgi:hypothetical protein
VTNLPPQNMQPATTWRAPRPVRWQVSGRLVAALATGKSRVFERETGVRGKYDNLSHNFFKGIGGKTVRSTERCVGITIGTTCHTCHRCHPATARRPSSATGMRFSAWGEISIYPGPHGPHWRR